MRTPLASSAEAIVSPSRPVKSRPSKRKPIARPLACAGAIRRALMPSSPRSDCDAFTTCETVSRSIRKNSPQVRCTQISRVAPLGLALL